MSASQTQIGSARSETRVEFDSVDEMELADHPTIKGLPRKRQNMGETLLGGEKGLPWLRIPDHVARLGRLISLQFGLVRLLAGWVPNCPSYALKTELPRLLYEDMRHLVRLHERFNQLPGAGSGIEPSAELKEFLHALGQADDHHGFLAAFYFDVKRALLIALEDYVVACDPLYDAPTLYELRGIIPELRQQIDWANQALLESRLDLTTGRRVEEWRCYIRARLAAVGGVLGEAPRPHAPLAVSPAVAPLQPAPEHFRGDPQMQLIDHFPLDSEEAPVHLTLREIIYHNATEWAAIDHLCVLFFAARCAALGILPRPGAPHLGRSAP